MAHLIKRRVANPAPAILAYVNPRRKKAMATQERKRHSSRRRARRSAANPRRHKTTSRRPRQHSAIARAHRYFNSSMRRRRRHRRRHNPVTGATVWRGIRLAGSGFAIGMIVPVVRRFATPYVGTSPIAAAGVTFGTSWLLSLVAKMIPFTRKYEDDILTAGATIATAQLISNYLTPYLMGLGGGAANPMMSGPYRRPRGLRGIGVTTGIPPTIVAPPLPAAAGSGNGMQGVAVVPGRFSR